MFLHTYLILATAISDALYCAATKTARADPAASPDLNISLSTALICRIPSFCAPWEHLPITHARWY